MSDEASYEDTLYNEISSPRATASKEEIKILSDALSDANVQLQAAAENLTKLLESLNGLFAIVRETNIAAFSLYDAIAIKYGVLDRMHLHISDKAYANCEFTLNLISESEKIIAENS